MLVDHPPFTRVTQDDATATDRQWLRLLNDAFSGLDYGVFITAGMDAQLATEILGLTALVHRDTDHE